MGTKASMTQLCTIAIQSSREVTPLRKMKAWRNLVCLLQMTDFSSSTAQTSGSHLLQESALFTGKGKEITSCLGCRTLCVNGSSQATFLTNCSLSPYPRCLRCSGVPFCCSSGHEWTFCYGSQGVRIWMRPKKLVLAHNITPLRREDSDKQS